MSRVGIARDSPPAIRLRPVPPLDPPYEDEVAPDAWASAFGAAQLPLDWLGTAHRPERRVNGSDPHLSAPGAVGGRSDGLPSTAVAGASAEAKAAVRRFLGLCLEILNGYRPVAHLRTLADPAAAGAVLAQLTAASGRVAELRGRGTSRGRPEPEPVRVRRLRVCEPRVGAAEATVVLLTGGRAWALALRLERRNDRWTATALTLV